MSKILVVDDEAGLRFALGEAIAGRGHDVVLAESGAAALHALDGVDVVVSDYAMPEMDGTVLLERILALDATLPVILVTAHGSEKLAVSTLKRGAYDYLTKPFDNEELLLSVERAAETRRMRLHEHQRVLEDEVGVRIIGRSPALVRAIEAATRVASKDVTVLVRGETGTGKELFATLLHARGASAKTCTTDSTSSSSSCRRYVIGRETSPCSRASSRASTASASTSATSRSWRPSCSRTSSK